MIVVCLDHGVYQLETINNDNQSLLKDAVWIDMFNPTREEEKLIETYLGQDIPTREEMGEIELSSRLYKEKDTLFMTALMIANADSTDPQFDPVSFILTPRQLITIRYIEPRAFKIVTSHFSKSDPSKHDCVTLLIELLDASVDRLADTLELVGRRMDDYSKLIFRKKIKSEKLDYRHLMEQMGANADLNTNASESLVTFNRLIAFLGQTTGSRIIEERQLRVATLAKDIISLSDHTIFLSSKVNFLLDATLGLVSIEQNNIIKIFSVAAVIFLPPTLVASIYGMNFQVMPELHWEYGYIYAIGLIALAAWLPYRYFKYRKWL